MIQKLQRKFIFILMSVVTLILLAVFVSMLLSTAGNTQRMSENLLRQALMMQHPQGFKPPQAGGRRNPAGEGPPNARMSILLVDIGDNGELLFLSNQLHFIEEAEAMTAVQTAVETGKNMGVLNGYGLRWMKSEDGSRIALVDISMEQEMLKNLIFNSLMIGGAALVVFFLASIFLSRWAVRPVERAWERQRQFVADASHELKTPLTVILSNADMLSVDGTFTDEKKARRMEHIQAEATRMKKLVEGLLMLARSDSAESVYVQERVDYSFIVTNAILTFEPIVFDDRKRLSYNVQDKLFVTGDSQRLQQLIAILLDNALKYCPPGGEIRLSLKEGEKQTAILVVINDGILIPNEELGKIFQRFYCTDKSRSAHGSFGLGLSIAESIVKEHNGTIWAESCDNTGNGFYVSLPLKLD